jgi:hypothetical protein
MQQSQMHILDVFVLSARVAFVDAEPKRWLSELAFSALLTASKKAAVGAPG